GCTCRASGRSRFGSMDQRVVNVIDAGFLVADRPDPILLVGLVAGCDYPGSWLASRARDQPKHDLQRAPRSPKPSYRGLHAVLFDWQRVGFDRFDGDVCVGRVARRLPAGGRYQRRGIGLLVADAAHESTRNLW